MGAVPIYSEDTRPAAIRPREAFPPSLLVALLAGGLFGVLVRPLPLVDGLPNVPAATAGALEAAIVVLLGAVASARLLALRRRPAVRAAGGFGLVALAMGSLAWALLALAGQGPLAAAESGLPGGGPLPWLAALWLLGIGETLAAHLTVAPWPRPLARARSRVRLALRVGAWISAASLLLGWPSAAPLQALPFAWLGLCLGALALPLVWRDRGVTLLPAGEVPSRRAPCSRCGVTVDFARGVSPCTHCGLLVRWDGQGPPSGGADHMSRA